MKKYFTLSIVALVLITLSGCQFNLFTEFDKIEIPSAAEMSSKADSDPDGFLDDVNDYVDSESISEDDAAGIIDALEIVYGDVGNSPEVQEQAAVLAGEIAISSDPETKELVDNIVSALTGLTDTTTGDEVLIGIFPENLTIDQFTDILDNLETAALAYADFAASIDDAPADGEADDGAAAWLDSTGAGDLAMYAAVAMISTGIRDFADNDDAIYDFIYNDAPDISGYDDGTENPLDSDKLSAILDLAGIVY
jgi:hypothetical protein